MPPPRYPLFDSLFFGIIYCNAGKGQQSKMPNAHVLRSISSRTDTTYIKHRLCKTSTMMTEKTSTKRGCSRSGFKWPIEGLVHRSWESVLCTLPDPVKAKPSLGRLSPVPRWWETCTSAVGTAPTLSPVTLQDPPTPIQYLPVRAKPSLGRHLPGAYPW